MLNQVRLTLYSGCALLLILSTVLTLEAQSSRPPIDDETAFLHLFLTLRPSSGEKREMLLNRRKGFAHHIGLNDQRAEILCGCSRACARMLCTLDLLAPVSAASLRTDQCVLPSLGFCCILRQTLACTVGIAVRGLLPLSSGSSPSMPRCSKRCFQRQIVGAVVRSAFLIRT